jgi:membrane-associated phospholipid phosphatase
MLGAVFAAMVSNRRLKVFLIVVAIGVSLAVGVSRVYLGVH